MERNYKVYVHINKINGKRYYGITKQEVEKRWLNGKGYSNNKHFTNAINKHGWNNFEHIVIARGLTEEEAKFLEIELIREHDTTNRDKGYNISLGGESWNCSEETRKKLSEAKKGHEVSEETRKKLSEALKGKNNPNYGKKHSEETRKKMSEALKGYEVTEEHRKKLSEAMKGKTHSEETRKKISEANRGHKHTEEARKKISETKKGKNTTKVYCVELDMYFNSIKEGAEYVGCDKGNISRVLGKNNRTAKGYHWLRAEDVDKLDKKIS